MRNWLMMVVVAGLTIAGTAYSVTDIENFEGIGVGTVVTGSYTISTNFSIWNYGDLNQMRVVEQGGATRAYSASNVPLVPDPNAANNWLPGDLNTKCFGNDADGSPKDLMDDLRIDFNPDIMVTSFSIDLADFGDYHHLNFSRLKATLTAYDSENVSIMAFVLDLPRSPTNDIKAKGLQTLSVAGADIAYVKLDFDPLDRGTGFDNLTISYTTRTLTVDIDIKPGSNPNSFNINGSGVIPVAILGSETFDVQCIDPATVTLAGLQVAIRGKNKLMVAYEDVSGPDGIPDDIIDLVIKFEDDNNMWGLGDSMAELKGNLKAECGGTPIVGWDYINVVP